MSVIHLNVTSGATPVLLIRMPSGIPNTAVSISNNHTAVVYLGDSTVSSAGATRGNQLAINGSQQVWLNANDELYVVSVGASAAGAISVIYSGV